MAQTQKVAKPATAKPGKVLPDISAPATVPAEKADKPKVKRAPWRTAIKTAGITLAPETKITVVPTANPKREGKKAGRRFAEVYKSCKTVCDVEAFYAERKKAGHPDYAGSTSARSNLNWDYQHGFITFS